jgi:hypothetical protein
VVEQIPTQGLDRGIAESLFGLWAGTVMGVGRWIKAPQERSPDRDSVGEANGDGVV